MTPFETETLKMFDEEIEALFKRGNEVVCVENHEETEYLHKEHGAYDSLSLDSSGNIKVTRIPAKFSTSPTVSEGAVDSRTVTAVDTTYTQKDIVKMLIRLARADERKQAYEDGYREGESSKFADWQALCDEFPELALKKAYEDGKNAAVDYLIAKGYHEPDTCLVTNEDLVNARKV